MSVEETIGAEGPSISTESKKQMICYLEVDIFYIQCFSLTLTFSTFKFLSGTCVMTWHTSGFEDSRSEVDEIWDFAFNKNSKFMDSKTRKKNFLNIHLIVTHFDEKIMHAGKNSNPTTKTRIFFPSAFSTKAMN